MKRILSVLITFFLMLTLVPCQATMQSHSLDSVLIVYPQYDERIQRCYDYGVTVHQGNHSEKLTVYNRNTSGEEMALRCFRPDFNRRFCEFAFTGEVRVDIEVFRDFSSYSILPSAKEYRNEYHDGIISVWLDENDTDFILRLDDDDDSILSVFADAPENYEIDKNDGSVLYVDEKWYDPDESSPVYTVPENIRTIYIAPGCVLYSRLFVQTKDVTVCGHGILLDPYSNVYDTSVAVNGGWSVCEAEFDLSDWDMPDDSAAHLRIGSDNSPGYDVMFRNIELTKTVPDIMGDVNMDGAFNIADVILLQKWLLAVPDAHLANWKAADFYDDHVLNVFDLCLMKRKLIYGKKVLRSG